MKVQALSAAGITYLTPAEVNLAPTSKIATITNGIQDLTPYTSLTANSVVACYDDSDGTLAYHTAGEVGLFDTYRAAVLADSPTGHWRLNDQGRTAADSIGTNHGALTAGVSVRVPGPMTTSGYAMAFDGTQGKIAFTNPALTGTFSLECWFYMLEQGFVGSTDYLTTFGIDGTHRLLVRMTTGEILAQMGGGNVTAAAATIAFGNWHHLVYTCNGSTQNLYLDGVNVGTLVTAGAAFNGAFWLGSHLVTSANYSFHGRISEAAVYNTELSAGRVAAHFAARTTPTVPVSSPLSITESQIQVSTNAGAFLPIQTPDGQGQVVEPSVEYVAKGWNGHKWWALITGYTNGDNTKENPAIYYSDDGRNFTPVPAATFPLVSVPATGNNADPEIRLGPDGRMYGFYITFNFPSTFTTVWCISSADGRNWTTPVQLWSIASSTEQATGPVFLYDDANACWVCWYVDAHGAGVFPIRRRICRGTDPTGTWLPAVTVTVNGLPGSRAPFEKHVERYNSTQLHMVCTFCDQGTGGANTTLHFGVSNDNGYTWNFNSTPFLSPSSSGWDNNSTYRGDIGPVLDGGKALYGFWYSGKNAGGQWRWGYTTISKT